jgi:hypothetical protein
MTPTPYSMLRPQMSTGDAILWQGEGLISGVIRKWSKFSHASLVVQFRRGHRKKVFLVEALPSGLELRSLSDRLISYQGRAFLYHTRALPFKRDKMWEFAISHCAKGMPYDYRGLLNNMFGRVSSDAAKFFCSEFVWAAWVHAGYVEATEKAPRPGDLPEWDFYRGELTEIDISGLKKAKS